MKTRTYRYLSIAAAAALGLTLASCSSDGSDDSGDTGANNDDTTTQPADEGGDEGEGDAAGDEGEGSGDEGEGSDDDGGDAGGAAGGAECLIGTWVITADAAEQQILAAYGGEGEASVEGTSTITLDGEVYTAEADTNATFSSEMEGMAVEGSTVTDGTFSVEYTADDSAITFGEVISADGTVTTTLNGADLTVDFADSASAMTGMSQAYTCGDDELTVTLSVGDMEIDQVYTRS